ncbi:MAG: tRNA-binding protein [Oceanospirillaceae bacterium]|nr:tRNA-binding protein [Oceanospirillaceae bacterium]
MTTVDYENFANLKLQTGTIVEIDDFKRARNPSYKVKVDFGNEDVRWSSAQITRYAKEELIGKQVICITNLPERNIAGFMSQMLILGVPGEDGSTILLTPDLAVNNGVRVF